MRNKFIRSTVILLIGGAITKLLGMIIKIIMTRNIGSTGMGIYMLLSPTFMLLISLAQLGTTCRNLYFNCQRRTKRKRNYFFLYSNRIHYQSFLNDFFNLLF